MSDVNLTKEERELLHTCLELFNAHMIEHDSADEDQKRVWDNLTAKFGW